MRTEWLTCPVLVCRVQTTGRRWMWRVCLRKPTYIALGSTLRRSTWRERAAVARSFVPFDPLLDTPTTQHDLNQAKEMTRTKTHPIAHDLQARSAWEHSISLFVSLDEQVHRYCDTFVGRCLCSSEPSAVSTKTLCAPSCVLAALVSRPPSALSVCAWPVSAASRGRLTHSAVRSAVSSRAVRFLSPLLSSPLFLRWPPLSPWVTGPGTSVGCTPTSCTTSLTDPRAS